MAKKSGGASLRRMFDAASGPLYLIDAKRRIAYCNPAFAAWCGYSLDALADRRVDYHSTSANEPIDEFANALCPPPSVFENQSLAARLVVQLASGDVVEQGVRFVPIGDANSVVGVIGIVDLDREPSVVRMIDEPAALHAQVAKLRRDIAAEFRMDRLLGVSPAIQQARRQIEVASASRANVLVAGPPGSGREHVARTIYYSENHDQTGMLVPLSCEILDAELLNTTIDALVNSQDIQSMTASALLLLDVDRLTASCQDALARWLLESDSPIRTIASTRTPLDPLRNRDDFRADLAMALSTLVIQLPTLQSRTEDIPILAQAFLEESNRLGGPQRGGFSAEAMERLIQHEYDENADELKRIVQQAATSSRGALIEPDELPDDIRWAADREAHPPRQFEEIDLDSFLSEIEQELIARAMSAAKGNRAQAAKLLGVSRAKLIRRLAENDGPK